MYVGGEVVIKWKSTVFFRKIVVFPHPDTFYNYEGESTLSERNQELEETFR